MVKKNFVEHHMAMIKYRETIIQSQHQIWWTSHITSTMAIGYCWMNLLCTVFCFFTPRIICFCPTQRVLFGISSLVSSALQISSSKEIISPIALSSMWIRQRRMGTFQLQWYKVFFPQKKSTDTIMKKFS